MDLEKVRRKAIWDQKQIPVVLRRGKKGQRIRVRLPSSDDSESWLRNGRRALPKWVESLECWELPKKWFSDFVERALNRFGSVYVFQPYREQEKCSPACLNAGKHECQCSCMGANHGIGNDGSWFEISETFATKWGEQRLACRLMRRKADQPAA